MRRPKDYFCKSSGERDYLNLELDVINLTKCYSTKMSYKAMRRKENIRII